jgi:DNA-binding MarR family transcriptional regulator
MATISTSLPHSQEERRALFLEMIDRVSPGADPTSVLLFRQVKRADRLLTRHAFRQLEKAGLSWPRFMLLMVLLANETFRGKSGLQPSELSEIEGIPRNSVSTLLAGLEEEGLVSRELHGKDRRKFVIHLTPQGRELLKSKLGTQFEQLTQCFAVFSDEERETLLDLLTRLTESLSEMHDRDEE